MAITLQSDGTAAARPIRPTGTASSGRFPLARLIQLIGLLQSERYPNARRLAEICEVSRRTIYRDLASLSDSGLSVLYRPDRLGYELERQVFLQPPRLEEREALALLLLSRDPHSLAGLGLGPLAAQAVDKVLQGLPDESRPRLLAASEVFVGLPQPISAVAEQREVGEVVLAALGRRRQLRLWLREPGEPAPSATKFSIFRMVPGDGDWCLFGRSTVHRRVIAIPLRRVVRVELTEDPYAIPPRFRLGRFMEPATEAPGCSPEGRVVLRFEPGVRARVISAPWPSRPDFRDLEHGGVELTLVADDLRHLVPLLLGFGTEVEVVEPASLRSALAEGASRIAVYHARGPAPAGLAAPAGPGWNEPGAVIDSGPTAGCGRMGASHRHGGAP
jgi:predicted DNA-binding transcriptional regulator YafY